MSWWGALANVFSRPAPIVVVDHPTQGPVATPVATRKANRFAAGTAGAALLVSTIGGFEGLVQQAYPDPATRGEPCTACYGHTGKDVTPGVTYAMAQCKAWLIQDTEYAWTKIQKCTKGTGAWGNSRAVAILSMAYNNGAQTYCDSLIAQDFNAGNDAAACDALLFYDKVTIAGVKKVFPGLTRRRQKERVMCLENI